MEKIVPRFNGMKATRIDNLRLHRDDSGDDRRERWVSSGGIVGMEPNIDLFEVLWLDRTSKLKKPFRSTECECQQGQFASWSKPDCDALMARLTDLICHEAGFVGGFSNAVPVPAYRRVFPSAAPDDPYRLTVAHAIVEMARLARRRDEQVKLCFEDSQEHHALVMRTYSLLAALMSWRSDERSRLIGISFASKALAPLQAADLVAREGFKVSDNFGTRRFRKPLLRMWDRVGMIQWSESALVLLRQGGWPDDMQSLVSLPDSVYVQKMPKNQPTG